MHVHLHLLNQSSCGIELVAAVILIVRYVAKAVSTYYGANETLVHDPTARTGWSAVVPEDSSLA